MPRVLLLFVDGVGLGDDDAAINPFLVASLPALHGLLGTSALTFLDAPHHAANASIVAIDATLGFDGTPQSGTGQAALLTGINAVAVHGRHFGPWVPARLRTLVREQSVLAQAAAAGRSVAFANAYPEEILRLVAADGSIIRPDEAAPDDGGLPSDAPDRAQGRTTGRRNASGRSRDADHRSHDAGRSSRDAGRSSRDAGRSSRDAGRSSRDAGRRSRVPAFLRAGPPLAALGAGLLTRHTDALESGDAVASEITNDAWRERLGRLRVPAIDAAGAGRNLARIVAAHDLTLFAHYSTDYAGHRRDMRAAVDALERLDGFIGGLVDGLDDDTLVFVVADHGNIEDVRTGHTRNPAIGLVFGAGHALAARRLRSLTDIAPSILDLLNLQPSVAG